MITSSSSCGVGGGCYWSTISPGAVDCYPRRGGDTVTTVVVRGGGGGGVSYSFSSSRSNRSSFYCRPPPPPNNNLKNKNCCSSSSRRRRRRGARICCESTPPHATAAVSYNNDNNKTTTSRSYDINNTQHQPNHEQQKQSEVAPPPEEEQIVQVLSAIRSPYNDILILETNLSNRFLLLDPTHNVHSIYHKGGEPKWTASYWDEFASLPAIVPKGPVAILGLGGGTAARLMLNLWPSLELEGWDIDEILIDKAREHLGLSDLEMHTPDGGILHVHIGDALSPTVHTPRGYAGIVIDLFADGKVLPELTEVATWLKLKNKLMPNGRLMVNCGAADNEVCNTLYPETSSDWMWENNLSIKAMCRAFPGQLINWKKMRKEEGENYLALSGALPDLNAWSAAVPDQLSLAVKQWRPCFP